MTELHDITDIRISDTKGALALLRKRLHKANEAQRRKIERDINRGEKILENDAEFY